MSNTTEEERPGEGSPLLSPKPGDKPDTNRRRVIVVSFAMVILVDFAAFFLEAPQTSILEGIICSRHYHSVLGEHDYDCTVGPVQAELATVNQMLNTFNRLPGLIVAIPFGTVADRYGRRPVLILAIIGALLQDAIAKVILWHSNVFPPRLIWLSSFGTFVGGGDAIASAMIFLVLADVALPGRRANLFFLLTSCGIISEILATPLSALLMSKTPWIPYSIYSVLTLLGGLTPLFFLPETLQRPSSPETETPSCGIGADEGQPAIEDETSPISIQSTIFSRFWYLMMPLKKRNIIAVLLAFFVSALGRQSTSFLLQYIRQRFNWKYEEHTKASLMITLRAAVNLAVLLVGLPALNKLLLRRKMSPPGMDLLISRLSIAFFAVGLLVVSVAPVVILAALGIVTFALGSGFAPAARSLVTGFCRQGEAGLLYSVLAITQSVGGLIAGPLLAVSFRWGLSLGHEWTGIPFALIAGLFGCGFFALSFVRL